MENADVLYKVQISDILEDESKLRHRRSEGLHRGGDRLQVSIPGCACDRWVPGHSWSL